MTKATTLILATVLLAGCQPPGYKPQLLREALQMCDSHRGVTSVSLLTFQESVKVVAYCADGSSITKRIEN